MSPPLSPSLPGRKLRQRHLDEVEYWRAQAGWSDGSDNLSSSSSETSTTATSTLTSGSTGQTRFDNLAQNLLKGFSVLVALGLCVMFYRAVMRRLNPSDSEKKSRSDRGRSDKSLRSTTSLRKSRSRSRSRKGEYDLMQDDGESRRSTRSRSSRSLSRRRSRSRSRTGRSRSKSRSRVEKTTPVPADNPVQKKETVLV